MPLKYHAPEALHAITFRDEGESSNQQIRGIVSAGREILKRYFAVNCASYAIDWPSGLPALSPAGEVSLSDS